MENVACCNLRHFMSLLYGLTTYKKLIKNKPKNDTYCMTLQFPDKHIVKQYYPVMKCPSSTVIFWCNRLGLNKRMDIASFDDFGYCCVEELVGELSGFYKFYEQSK